MRAKRHGQITPTDFERLVHSVLKRTGGGLRAFSVRHLERVKGADGSYVIDVTARFEALGFEFLMAAECRRHANPIKREAVIALHGKMQSLGAQKAALFATSLFQRGAVEYALAHGVALVHVVDRRFAFITKATAGRPASPRWLGRFELSAPCALLPDPGEEEVFQVGYDVIPPRTTARFNLFPAA